MINCPSCNSQDIQKKGKDFRHGKISQRHRCKTCEINFYEDDIVGMPLEYTKTALGTLPRNDDVNTFVVTAVVNNVPVNTKLFNTLLNYCKINNARLLIIPIKYDQDGSHEYLYDHYLKEYFIDENIKLCTGLKLMAGINISPAIGNPLTSFENFSQGESLIIAHPQLALKSIAMSHVDPATIMYTTSAISENIYTDTKQGTKASYNHSFGALVVEEDFEIDGFHIRHLNSSDEGSFYDLDKFYDGELVLEDQTIEAIVLGDEHTIHADQDVTRAHFTNKDSIVNVLKPKFIVRHDSLDFYSGSHHHNRNIFTTYAKHQSGANNVEAELDETIAYVLNTTPEFAESIIISSNHNNHLLQWLQETNPKLDPTNALFYHEMMVMMLKKTKMEGSMATYPNPFKLWWESRYTHSNIKFVSEQSSFKIHGVELAFHSDKGTNGARGSIVGFSKLGMRTIIGHSHSPGIFCGCYQTGTSSKLKLDYNTSASSWCHADVLIHKNSKRQMIFIIKGKWRR